MTSIQHRQNPSEKEAAVHEHGTDRAGDGGSERPEASTDERAADDAPDGDGRGDHGSEDDEGSRSSGDRGPAAPEPSDPVDLDVVFDILKNRRRRLVLEYLPEEGQTSLSDLAEYIAAVENDKPTSELSSQERKRVYVGLYQCHLPRMDDSDAVVFDKNRGTVEPGPNIDAFYTYLERTERDEPTWSVRYFALAAASIVAVTGTQVLMESLATLVFAASLVGFSTLALVHFARFRT